MSTADQGDPPSYARMREELESILQTLEEDEPDLDTLGPRVERAAFLLKCCEALLQQTEVRVRDALLAVDSLTSTDTEREA